MEMASYGTNHNQGTVLVEVLISVVVFSIITSVSLPIIEVQFKSLERLNIYGHVLYSVRAILEKTIAYNTPQYLFDGEKNIDIHSTDISVEPCLKEAVVVASTSKNFSMSPIVLAMLHIDHLAVAALGNDCGGFMDPQSLSIPLKIISTTSIFANYGMIYGTSTPKTYINSMDFYEGYAYIGASSTDGFNFLTINTNQANHPILSRLKVPPVNSLDVAGGYAYLAVVGSTSQFQVIDIRDPNSPSVVATYSLPGVSGSYPSGLSIYYYAGRIYIGTHRTAGNEFHIFDVTVPSQPRWLGSVWLNHNIYDITVSGSYAYLAASGNTSDIIVVDVSDPTHPVKVASLAFTGKEYTQRVFLLGTILYAGRRKGSLSSHPELIALDIHNPRAPTIIASTSIATTINSIRAIAGNVLVATKAGIFSLPSSTTSVQANNFLGKPRIVTSENVASLDYENNVVYGVVNKNSPTLFSFIHQ